MNTLAKIYLVLGITLVLLLLIGFFPPITIGDTTLRPVDVIGDLLPAEETLPEDTLETTPPADTAGLYQYPELAHFYDMLAAAPSLNRPVRVAYYGDSFAAGDVFVGALRKLLQTDFGGAGVGLIDCASKRNEGHLNLIQKTINLQGYDAVNDYKTIEVSRQGVGQSYTLMTADSASTTVTFIGDAAGSTGDKTLLYLRTASPLTISALGGETETLLELPRVQVAQFKGGRKKVQLTFTGQAEDVTLLGMSHESSRGVIVDNLALVGNSGLGLAKLPEDMLADMSRLRPYDLVILEFGLNMVADCSTDERCEGYMNALKLAVKRLRLLAPKASVLVLGVSDMMVRQQGKLVSHPNIERLSRFQQRFAQEIGAAYISLTELMGGAGSMAVFVADKRGEKDYTHLTYSGGKDVAQKCYHRLRCGFETYKQHKTSKE